MRLVEAIGFDAFDTGTLAGSWRQQPGSPVFWTNLKKPEMTTALGTAEKERLPKRRDLVTAVVLERFGAEKLSNSDADFLTTLNRIIYR